MQRLLTIFILSAFFLNIHAQVLNCPVKKIDGKEYYIYTVELQEGLYSISKKFGVKQVDIIALNPESEKGLKAGQLLIIPKNGTAVSVSKSSNYTPESFTYHIVEKKQTLYSLSRKYSTPVDSILKYNQFVERGLQVGDTLRFPGDITPKRNIFEIIFGKYPEPVITEDTKSKPDEKTTDFIYHTVKQKETLYSISRAYDVKIEDIVALNPGTEVNLRTGREIKIPKKTVSTDIESKEEEDKTVLTGKITEKDIESAFGKKKTLQIAYLLPFMLDQMKVEPGNERFLDFYAGSLLAINEARKEGLSFEIYTYDTERNELKLNEILTKPEIQNVDLIIGPAYTNQVAMIGDFALKNRVNTLVPFTSKIYDIDSNPYLIQFNPGIIQTAKFVAEQLKTKYRHSKIIFANNTEVYNADDGKTFCELLRNELTELKRNFTNIEITNAEQVDFMNNLEKYSKNIIFFNTDKFSNVNMFLSWLESNSAGYDLAYFRHTGWAETEYNYLKTISATPFKNYFNTKDLNKYQENFESGFGKQPSVSVPSYDLLGYDLTKYFIKTLNAKGKDFKTEALKLNDSKGIQSDINFERNSENSGIINNKLYISEK